MARHALLVLDPDGEDRLVDLPGEPDGHADLERAAGVPLWPAGPELASGGVVLHRGRGPLGTGPASVPRDVAALVAQVRDEESGRRPVPAARAPWYRAGWGAEAVGWVDAQLGAAGRPRTGTPRVVSSWALSLLLRVPTDTGPVWLKGCAPHFPAEPGVTRWLADRHPGAVPDVLAADPDRGLLLMGPLPPGEATPADLPAVADRAAALQLATVGSRAELADLGVPARGLAATAGRFGEVVEAVLATGPVRGEAADRVRSAVPDVLRRVEELAALGLPDTLCHGDLHLGNVVRGVDGPVLFDWSDACWGHPFLDVVHLPQVGSGARATPGWERPYLDRWRAAGWSTDVLDAASRAAGPVERAFQAVTYADLQAALEPGAARALEGVLPRILGQIADLVALPEQHGPR